MRKRQYSICFYVSAIFSIAVLVFVASTSAKNVPYVRTPEYAMDKMLKLAHVGPGDVVYDLGCGDGRIVIEAAKKFGARGVGIDINPVRIEESKNYARRAGVNDRTNFFVHDALTAKFGDATVVCLYMLPEFNIKLRPHLLSQLKPGTRIVAYTFGIGDWLPDKTINSGSPGYDIYLWIVPANIAGDWDCKLATPAGSKDVMLALSQKYQQVSGIARVDGQSYPLRNPKLTGNKLTFTLKWDNTHPSMKYNVSFGAATRPTTRPGSQSNRPGQHNPATQIWDMPPAVAWASRPCIFERVCVTDAAGVENDRVDLQRPNSRDATHPGRVITRDALHPGYLNTGSEEKAMGGTPMLRKCDVNPAQFLIR